METHIPTILLTLGLLSVANCYLRGDYNPALFMFSYFLWNLKVVSYIIQPHLRQTLVYVIFYSWFIDLVWTLTYLLLWRSDSFQIYRTNFNNTTLLVSAILFTLKVTIL